jgi:hypothetical protein
VLTSVAAKRIGWLGIEGRLAEFVDVPRGELVRLPVGMTGLLDALLTIKVLLICIACVQPKAMRLTTVLESTLLVLTCFAFHLLFHQLLSIVASTNCYKTKARSSITSSIERESAWSLLQTA